MLGRRGVTIEGSYMPINTHITQGRITEVAEKLDITGRATAAGRKEEPHTSDTDLDENQRVIIAESEGFVGGLTRRAAAEIAERIRQVRELLPRLLETALEQVNIRRLVAETRDRSRGDLDRAFADRQRKLSATRAFEEQNRLAPLSATYKNDKAMFVASLGALTIGEGAFNAFSFEQLQDDGLLGGLLLAMTVSVANILMGLGCGWLGWRLLAHIRWDHKLLGALVTGVLMAAAFALHLALGDLRQAIIADPKAKIDFLVILNPSRWFAYSSISPFVLFAIGVATFLIAAFKGRGSTWGIVAPYWGHEIFDREFREADGAFEDAKENLVNTLMNAFDGGRKHLRDRYDDDESHVKQIRRLAAEAEGIERSLGDSIQEEMGRLHIWLRMSRDRNRAVRTTPAPAYFGSYPEFEEWRSSRLDLTELKRLVADAERVLAENAEKLAAIEEKTIQEQTAAIDAMLTVINTSERRAAQQVDKDDGGGKPRS